ncbi:YcaO-like family protein [Salidesulfovibrio onnuriiensis]|uniref:YcaO-like family protein n=1 Tax=Salidesulfovibrio onnuriiensis TaxID=2583823 RepID=UPI0011CC4A71|nr:YcaO-like family protein [Salidesulfovibrio onnuriiensis]
MLYKLQLMDTQSGVGCFAAVPDTNLSFNDMLAALRAAPFDDYMHEFVLQHLDKQRPKKVEKLIREAAQDGGRRDPVVTALLYEASLCHERLKKYLPLFDGIDPRELSAHTPAIHIRSSLLEDRDRHQEWIKIFRANIQTHTPLQASQELGMNPPFSGDIPDPRKAVRAGDIRKELDPKLPAPKKRAPMQEVTQNALSVLGKAGAFMGPAMAHKASLSPVNRLRHWHFTRTVSNGRNRITLDGIQTCYGRGLTDERADVSYSMEMAERFSAYADIRPQGVTGYAREYPLKHARLSELGAPALDPNSFNLEVPYTDQKLYWMEAHMPDGAGGQSPIWIPVQFVFLFNNCDEVSLFSALGSTGLASGNTFAEAKVSGLLEVIERDSGATIPFDLSRAFRIETDDPEITKLLDSYKDCGIDVWFLDMTPEFGVPCYKSVVLGKHGDVIQGSGADLCGKNALLSAMTETPYPFPGQAGSPGPKDLPVRRLEDLPDYSTGSAEGDLMVLEATLAANGYTPCYVDLMRKDLQIPVVRAFIPGLELIADFDHYSRVSPRLFANYLELFK